MTSEMYRQTYDILNDVPSTSAFTENNEWQAYCTTTSTPRAENIVPETPPEELRSKTFTEEQLYNFCQTVKFNRETPSYDSLMRYFFTTVEHTLNCRGMSKEDQEIPGWSKDYELQHYLSSKYSGAHSFFLVRQQYYIVSNNLSSGLFSLFLKQIKLYIFLYFFSSNYCIDFS